MSELNARDITKVLERLIGDTEAIGDSWADEKIEKNLMLLIDITNWCLDGVFQSSETCGRVENSMHRVGFRARCALVEFRDWLNEVIAE